MMPVSDFMIERENLVQKMNEKTLRRGDASSFFVVDDQGVIKKLKYDGFLDYSVAWLVISIFGFLLFAVKFGFLGGLFVFLIFLFAGIPFVLFQCEQQFKYGKEAIDHIPSFDSFRILNYREER